ncbi:MAG: F0F1 ATP synthase subunit B [Clostridiales bacterium]|nr:F0F1 ATP synthase subunit B [Clostridiales bacterium]MDY5350270.1 F0F1 ATP synthase subunit B [Candidatus Ventricola sp.]MDY5514216.1 F0F1 ATP synthase subunit B [Candidatus Ventricola sp.]
MEVQKFISIAPWTMIFQLINLLILMVAFKKFLFKPVMAILEKRRAEIEGHYEEAEKAETAAKTMKADYEEKMAGAREEADRVIRTATESANAMSQSIVSDAREQAGQIKRRAESEIEMERRKAFDEVKGELSGIALDIAQQVIEREVKEKDHEAFINEFIENVGEAS